MIFKTDACLGQVSYKYPNIEVIDILRPSNVEIRHQFFKNLPTLLAENPKDRLLRNYVNLESELDKYLSFTLCRDSEGVMAFSGLMLAHFKRSCRALTRTYYVKRHRQTALGKKQVPNVATALMLPAQVETAIASGMQSVFVSMEGKSRKPYFTHIFNELNQHWQQGQWIVLDGLYNTCRRIGKDQRINDEEGCWHSVAYLSSSSLSKPQLPKRSNAH